MQVAFENALESQEVLRKRRSKEMSIKLHMLEKHFRKNKLQVS